MGHGGQIVNDDLLDIAAEVVSQGDRITKAPPQQRETIGQRKHFTPAASGPLVAGSEPAGTGVPVGSIAHGLRDFTATMTRQGTPHVGFTFRASTPGDRATALIAQFEAHRERVLLDHFEPILQAWKQGDSFRRLQAYRARLVQLLAEAAAATEARDQANLDYVKALGGTADAPAELGAGQPDMTSVSMARDRAQQIATNATAAVAELRELLNGHERICKDELTRAVETGFAALQNQLVEESARLQDEIVAEVLSRIVRLATHRNMVDYRMTQQIRDRFAKLPA